MLIKISISFITIIFHLFIYICVFAYTYKHMSSEAAGDIG